ncbi:MAG: hypothetical protein H6733_11525 [Alphaproteobacteria bacterium]|nr:hypothetical protein [Alphaproteobacteria bacterium]
MADLKIRVYECRFGDAVLVQVPDRDAAGVETLRHVLIDVGNVLSGDGGDDVVFEPIVRDVLEVLDGAPLDLYVMTHEHMDHVQGLPWVDKKGGADLTEAVKARLDVRHAWLTASSAPDYGARFPDAKRAMDAHDRMHAALARQLHLLPADQTARWTRMLLNNNPRDTGDCVAFLQQLAAHTHYVHRGFVADASTHGFAEATFELWAPEADTSDYYGRFRPLALGLTGEAAAAAGASPQAPPRGVAACDWQDLVEARSTGFADNLLAIDKARNNTSVVFTLAWRGWTLLFAGDAEVRSWKTMQREGVLRPVHFLKVSHHGSHNGTPDDGILQAVLPVPPPDARPRTAVISTCGATYNDIPHPPTNSRLVDRGVQLLSTVDLPRRTDATGVAFHEVVLPG